MTIEPLIGMKPGVEIKLASQITLIVKYPMETFDIETEFGERVTIQLGAVGELMVNGFRLKDLIKD